MEASEAPDASVETADLEAKQLNTDDDWKRYPSIGAYRRIFDTESKKITN
jgi:hypothetical protein